MNAKRPIRCAIYTRKSTEEGLEQGFNSLDAQREACEAYVVSQKAEGWISLGDRYDDGGYSGGTLERPALQSLLQDIKAGRVDVVVIYKIDRLSRSLMDFAKLVGVFDQHAVTFVSVTQSFSTTTSMGRLTLNVLLSFAQFEREVTGERIRDKFAASKKKGMWMGGTPPLGYDICERKLLVNEAEAETVRLIFQRYLDLGCVRALRDDLRNNGVVSKIWTSRNGKQHGNQPFDRGALYCLLKNRVYLGLTMHKGTAYPGEHQAIVPRRLFDSVRERLDAGRHPERRARNTPSDALLAGLIFDDRGNPMTPTYTRKPDGREYRYYISTALDAGAQSQAGSISRVPAKAIEDIIEQYLQRLELVANPANGRRADSEHPAQDAVNDTEYRKAQLRSSVKRIEIHARSIVIHMDREVVVANWRALADTGEASDTDLIVRHATRLGPDETLAERDDVLVLTMPVRAKFRGGRAQIQSSDGRAIALAPRIDPVLVKAIARAHAWAKILMTGEVTSVDELAERANQHRGYVREVLRLAFLNPDITRSILEGGQRPDLTLAALLETDIPLSWSKQASAFA